MYIPLKIVEFTIEVKNVLTNLDINVNKKEVQLFLEVETVGIN